MPPPWPSLCGSRSSTWRSSPPWLLDRSSPVRQSVASGALPIRRTGFCGCGQNDGSLSYVFISSQLLEPSTLLTQSLSAAAELCVLVDLHAVDGVERVRARVQCAVPGVEQASGQTVAR